MNAPEFGTMRQKQKTKTMDSCLEGGVSFLSHNSVTLAKSHHPPVRRRCQVLSANPRTRYLAAGDEHADSNLTLPVRPNYLLTSWHGVSKPIASTLHHDGKLPTDLKFIIWMRMSPRGHIIIQRRAKTVHVGS